MCLALLSGFMRVLNVPYRYDVRVEKIVEQVFRRYQSLLYVLYKRTIYVLVFGGLVLCDSTLLLICLKIKQRLFQISALDII